MSNIDRMSMEEILEEITFNLNWDDLIFITSDCPEIREEIENPNNLVGINGMDFKMARAKVRKIFIKYEEKLDKAQIVLLTAFNSQKMIEDEEIDPIYRKKLKENVAICLRMLGGKNITAVTAVDRNEGDWVDLVVINSTEFAKIVKRGEKLRNIGNNTTRKRRERLETLDESLTLSNIARLLLLKDIAYICTEQEVANMIIYQISHNGFSDYVKAHPDRRAKFRDNRDLDEIEGLIENNAECLKAKTYAIVQNCKYIDIDKMLLIAAYRVLELIEYRMTVDSTIQEESQNEEESIFDEETLNLYYDFLRDIYAQIQEGTTIGNVIDSEKSYTLPKLELDLRRFINGRYITRKQTKELKGKLLEGEVTLEESDELEVSLIKFSKDEFIQVISQSEENAIYFMQGENITRNDVIFLLNRMGKCSKKMFGVIEEKALLGPRQILDLFEKGLLNTEIISSIQDPKLLEEVNNHVKAMIIELNKIAFEDGEKQDAEALEYFTKYVALYKTLNITEKTEEEILENSFKLISSLENSLDNETLERLYQYGIIPLESAVDWGVNLITMLANNSIKPNDLKELYAKGIIQLDEIKRVISQTNLQYDEKMDLIFSTFDGDSQEEKDIRDELIELLESVDAYKEKSKGTKRVKPVDPKVKSFEYVTDPLERWRVFSAIDKEGSKKILPHNMEVRDGHRVFFFPNYGEVLIEKMYEKRYGETDWAYASATYIMKIETFFRFADEIIIKGAINRTFLGELYRSDDAFRQIHGPKWAEHVLEHFGIIMGVENEKHTEEEIKKLYELAERVKMSRKIRE